MDPQRLVKISKYLSKHLRHQPERLGLTLEPGGWVAVADLLAACAAHRFPLSRADLDAVVAGSDKKRFGYDDGGTRIRANQGHSTAVDLQLETVAPPPTLYHGTHPGVLDAIRADGLKKMARHHVHLSADAATARTVGARRGRPVILEIDAAAMQRDGYLFYRSDNGVWLVDAVQPQYLREP